MKDGRLKFAEKSKARPEGEPDPKVEEDLFVEPVGVFMVDIAKTIEAVEPDYHEKMNVFFPKSEEQLIDFLNWCKLKDSKVMLCLCCSDIFDREAEKELENTNTKHLKKV